MWLLNIWNICTNDYIGVEIFKYSKLFKYLQCINYKNKSRNECLNIFVTRKYNKYFYKWIYSFRNIWIFKYIQIFVLHWAEGQSPSQELEVASLSRQYLLEAFKEQIKKVHNGILTKGYRETAIWVPWIEPYGNILG